MKINLGAKRKGISDSIEEMQAKVAAAQKIIDATRKHLKMLKAERKQTRKALKQIKKAAKRARKEVELAVKSKAAKTSVKPKSPKPKRTVRKSARGSKAPGDARPPVFPAAGSVESDQSLALA